MAAVMLWAIERRALATALIALVTVILGLQIGRLEVDTSTESFMVESDPAKPYHEWYKQRFGGGDRTIVLVKAADLFSPAALGAIRALSDALAELPGVTQVQSLVTVRDFRAEGDLLRSDPLVPDPVPTAPEALRRVRERTMGTAAFVGTFVSRDGRTAAIVVQSESDPRDKAFNRRFAGQVEAVIARAAAPGLTIYQIGGPIGDATVGQFIFDDLKVSVPISLAVLFVLLFLAFRSLQGVVIPLVTSVLSIVWGLGVMGWLGMPVNVLTACIPSLLIVIGATEDVHMLTHYHHQLELGLDRFAALRAMAHETALPILVTTGTTVVGFASLVTSDITMLAQFGIASALGLTANFVVTVIVLPVMLAAWPTARAGRHTAFEDEGVHGFLPPLAERLGALTLRFRVPIVVVAVALALGSLVGWYRLHVDTDALQFFAEGSFIRRRIADFQASMGGPSSFAVVVESGRPDGIADPAVLRRLTDVQAFLERQPGVDKTLSVADHRGIL